MWNGHIGTTYMGSGVNSQTTTWWECQHQQQGRTLEHMRQPCLQSQAITRRTRIAFVTPLAYLVSCIYLFLSISLICVLPARLSASTRLLWLLPLISILSSYSLDASFIHTFLSWPYFPRASRPLTICVPSSITCTRESFLQL